MPAFNEEKYIAKTIIGCRKYVDKVVVVDDGSTDRTSEVARLAGAEVIRHPENRGKGTALKTGFEAAAKNGTEVIVTMDADGQHDPAEVPKLVAPILKGEADIVNGSRYMNGNDKNTPFYRRLGQSVLDKATNLNSGLDTTDTQSGFRAFAAHTIPVFRLEQNGFGIESEMLADAANAGLRVKEVEIGIKLQDMELKRHPEVSVVIPTKNEEKSIGICVEKIQSVFKEHNIYGEIIVSDSSTDSTPEIAKALGAKVVVPDKLGYGYAYRYGFANASGDYIVMGDGDNTYDFVDIPRLLEPLKRGDADLVIGSRFKGEIKKGAMPWLHKHIGNPVLTWFLNSFFTANVSDAHSGFRAFTKEGWKSMRLRSRGMEFASEMIIEAMRRGLRIKEVPITYYPRGGESKLSSFNDGWRHLKFMLLYTPKHLYIIPGFGLFIFGILMMLSSYFHIHIGYTPGIHSMIVGSLSSIVGYEIMMLGLFAGVHGKKNDILEIDGITKAILKHTSLERGLALGVAVLIAGFAYSMKQVLRWWESGFNLLPMNGQDMIGFTFLVIGVQTVFFSFFLSMIGGENEG